MALTLVTAPAATPVTLDEVKVRCRVAVDITDEDALLLDLIQAAVSEIDGSEGWLGRALITQTWDMTLDAWPASDRFNPWGAIQVPLPPLQTVTYVKYYDSDNVLQTLSASLYTVITDSEPGRIALNYGQSWPVLYPVPNTITVRFVAGFSASAEAWPLRAAPVRTWLKDRVMQMYDGAAPLPSVGLESLRVRR